MQNVGKHNMYVDRKQDMDLLFVKLWFHNVVLEYKTAFVHPVLQLINRNYKEKFLLRKEMVRQKKN